jgi:outer membrane immunogenic protein
LVEEIYKRREKMRQLFWASFLGSFAAFVLAGQGRTADLSILQTKAPAATTYVDPWTGLYLGIHGGYGLARGASTICCDAAGLAADLKTAPQGFVGGLHGGYMAHIPGSGFIFGLEGDGDVATLDGTANNPGFIGNANSKNRWLVSFRGRLGYVLVPNTLAYVTGGWGWGSSDFSVQNTEGTAINLSVTKNGAVLGGGLEVALSSQWFIRTEYLHYFFNDTTMSMPAGNFLRASDNVSVARAGLTYKF